MKILEKCIIISQKYQYNVLNKKVLQRRCGAATMIAQESYEYAISKTEEELYENAAKDVDDLLWIGSGVLTMAHGFNLYKAYTIPDEYYEITAEEFKQILLEEGINDDLIYYGGVTYRDTQTGKLVVKINKQCIDTLKQPKAIIIHERIGESAIIDDIVNIPDFSSIPKSYYANRFLDEIEYSQNMVPDIIASRFIGKKPFIKLGRDWWQEFPELSKLIEKNIPYTFQRFKNGQLILTGANLLKEVSLNRSRIGEIK